MNRNKEDNADNNHHNPHNHNHSNDDSNSHSDNDNDNDKNKKYTANTEVALASRTVSKSVVEFKGCP